MIEILNLRKTQNGYLINGLIETIPSDANYNNALKWVNDGKEVMSVYTEQDILNINKPNKQLLLDDLIITISTGKRFYADAESRTDLLSAIFEAQNQGATDVSVSNWKTPDGIVSVNLAELKEASKKALEAKAGIIGVS